MNTSPLLRRAILALSTVARPAGLTLAGAFVLCAATSVCLAQASSGITGTVTDPSGAIVPGANVTIVNVATQQTFNVVSGSAGQYTVTGLQPGRYKVTVAAPGFSKAVKDDVNVEVTTQATIDLRSTPAEVRPRSRFLLH